jgi:hypothetical protein
MVMKLFRRYKKIPLHNEQQKRPVPIVGDAAIATATIANGRLIPLIIADTEGRGNLDELIRLHEHLPPGDVEIQWGELVRSTGKLTLLLSFIRPVATIAILQFDIVTQGILVDQILAAKVFYLQSRSRKLLSRKNRL